MSVPEQPDFEPHVGEIRAVRTFRVGPGGVLYPLFGKSPWQDGTNAATCARLDTDVHVAPDPGCTCGFYAYADEFGAREYPHARYLLAVVSCWGRIVTGTRGLRAQYARIDALWLSGAIPSDLADAVTDRYRSARIFADRAAMFAAYPCADPDIAPPEWAEPHPRSRRASRIVAAIAIAGGLLSGTVISSFPYGWWLWAGLVLSLVLAAAAPLSRPGDPVENRRRLVCFALALWLLSPLVGVAAGTLFLRMPLIQICVLAFVRRRALDRHARTFPAAI